jgi:hypothetical protein
MMLHESFRNRNYLESKIRLKTKRSFGLLKAISSRLQLVAAVMHQFGRPVWSRQFSPQRTD